MPEPMVRLNLGCGHIQPAGWLNVDGSNRAWLGSRWPRLDRTLVRCGVLPATDFNRTTIWANLLHRFPWPSAAIDAVYMGELLEHFTQAEGRHVLAECHRILRPGGRIRLRVPDHAEFWRHYVNDYDAVKARAGVARDLSHTRWTRMYFDTICVARPKPWHSMGHFHKWMYDDLSLIAALEEARFRSASRRAFRDSDIPGIAVVESRDELIVEAVK